MIQYTIRFCYQYPGSEFLNATGRSLGDNTIRKFIAKGEALNKDIALCECEAITGIKPTDSPFSCKIKRGSEFYSCRTGRNSGFTIELNESK